MGFGARVVRVERRSLHFAALHHECGHYQRRVVSGSPAQKVAAFDHPGRSRLLENLDEAVKPREIVGDRSPRCARRRQVQNRREDHVLPVLADHPRDVPQNLPVAVRAAIEIVIAPQPLFIESEPVRHPQGLFRNRRFRHPDLERQRGHFLFPRLEHRPPAVGPRLRARGREHRNPYRRRLLPRQAERSLFEQRIGESPGSAADQFVSGRLRRIRADRHVAHSPDRRLQPPSQLYRDLEVLHRIGRPDGELQTRMPVSRDCPRLAARLVGPCIVVRKDFDERVHLPNRYLRRGANQ